jgi:hypothetical protein
MRDRSASGGHTRKVRVESWSTESLGSRHERRMVRMARIHVVMVNLARRWGVLVSAGRGEAIVAAGK